MVQIRIDFWISPEHIICVFRDHTQRRGYRVGDVSLSGDIPPSGPDAFVLCVSDVHGSKHSVSREYEASVLEQFGIKE